MHEPVMLRETVEGLNVGLASRVIDATFGGGGHAKEILKNFGADGVFLGMDSDPDAIKRGRGLLDKWPARILLRQANFAEIKKVARECGLESVDAILMDLGVSSFQLEDARRGFSFQNSGPLDMRMDPRMKSSAADVVNSLREEDLANIFWRLGEERSSRSVAKSIVEEREKHYIDDTARLADIVEKAKGGRRSRLHPATKVFMALRIYVNNELKNLEKGLEDGLDILEVGGRMAVISFHSMEDRIVKVFFKEHAGREESLQAGGSRWVGKNPPVKLIGRRPIVPTEDETKGNPRSRSAKLRLAERCG